MREFIDGKGYGQYFIHRTGHSITSDIHGNGANLDNLETKDDREILPNTCFSVEPGIYLPEFGVRSEINMMIRKGKGEVTGRIQNELVQHLMANPKTPAQLQRPPSRPQTNSMATAGPTCGLALARPRTLYPAPLYSRPAADAGRLHHVLRRPGHAGQGVLRSTPATCSISWASSAISGAGGLYILARIMDWGIGNIHRAVADYGTKYIVVAGLLNIVAAVDAYHIAIGKKQ